MKYGDKMKDLRWLKKRIEVLERDCNTCQECGKIATSVAFMTVHHNFYFRRYKQPWDYPVKMLTSLCWDCHKNRGEAIDLLHTALLNASTGDLIVWAMRIKKEVPNLKRKLTRQAKKNKTLSPPNPTPLVFPTTGQSVWDRMREAANGLVQLQEANL